MFTKFLKTMKVYVPEDARIMSCQFRGDPNSDIYGKWRARVLRRANMVDDLANVYLCVSAMRQNSRGEWRRRKENFAGGLLLMIDDLGKGEGSKFPLSLIDALQPTCLVETSPENFQATYFFDHLCQDIEKFDALIRAFIEKQFLGSDTGQAGVNRVFRPPAGINGKEKYRQDTWDQPGRAPLLWRVIGHNWHPECRYSIEDIAKAFKLKLQQRRPMPRHTGTMNSFKAERIRAFIDVQAALRSAHMIKREEPDYSGWMQVYCPWTEEHTGAADTGAAVRVPAEENEWGGAFRCHHGHCEERGWRDLTDWIAKHAATLLEEINRNAPAIWRFDD